MAPYIRGWRSYFGFCETPEVLVALTRWVRLRLRAALWRQWKTPRRRRAALVALRVFGQLCNTADSGRGPWYIARSKALSVGLSNAHFKSLGLPSLIIADVKRRSFYHTCFARRLGGVSGGRETQGWRDSSHTPMVGAGKFGSAKLPMATATYPGKPSPSQ